MEISNIKTILYNTTVNNNQELINNITVGDKVSLINETSAVDEVILSVNSVPHSNVTTTTEPVTYTVTTETPMNNIQNIKEMLYKINHPAEGFVSGGSTESGEIGDAWDILQHIHRASDSTVNANVGVSRGQLLQLTHRDDWEEGNSSLFGNINLAFDKLDVNGDNSLSFSELKNFTGYELGSTKTNFQNKVDTYAAQIQQEYLACGSMNSKLNFAIDKAVDYMEAMGMTDHLAALRRLQNEGKIGVKDCNDGADFNDYLTGGATWTLGAYSFYPYVNENDPSTSADDGVLMLYATDDNAGLFLDQTYYAQSNIQWYELVSTVIHELTHATAYLYSGYPSENKVISLTNPYDGQRYGYPGFTSDTLDRLRDSGCITDVEYNSYKTKLANSTLSYDEYFDLVEKTEVMWGEFLAYQTNEDYLDSVAHGDYRGSAEANGITSHINSYYTDEPVPTGDWWKTYGKIGYNA